VSHVIGDGCDDDTASATWVRAGSGDWTLASPTKTADWAEPARGGLPSDRWRLLSTRRSHPLVMRKAVVLPETGEKGSMSKESPKSSLTSPGAMSGVTRLGPVRLNRGSRSRSP
jgi:hypothetical protein